MKLFRAVKFHRKAVPVAMHLAESREELELLASHSGRMVEMLQAMDAWHPSVKGHSVLAKAALSDLPPSLEFLGIERKTNASSVSMLGQQSARR